MKRNEDMAKDLQPRKHHYEPEVKFRILHLLEKGIVPPEEIAESFGISTKTLYNWRNEYDEHGMAGLEDSAKSGRPALVSSAAIKRSLNRVSKCGIVTLKKAQKQISEDHGIRYSNGHTRSILAKMGLTYKKADPVHRRAATNEEIEEWAAETMPIIEQHLSKGFVLVSADEVHPGIDDTVHYGYAERGQRVFATHHGTKSRLNIVGGIASRGRAVFIIQKKSNSSEFIRFLEELKKKFPKAIILLDNASYHVSKAVAEWFADNPGIVPIYLPVGSPHMNVIENLWGMMNSYLGQAEYASFEKFRYHVLYFLRRRKFDLDVRGKLDSRLDPAAEAQVIRNRKQLSLLQYQ